MILRFKINYSKQKKKCYVNFKDNMNSFRETLSIESVKRLSKHKGIEAGDMVILD